MQVSEHGPGLANVKVKGAVIKARAIEFTVAVTTCLECPLGIRWELKGFTKIGCRAPGGEDRLENSPLIPSGEVPQMGIHPDCPFLAEDTAACRCLRCHHFKIDHRARNDCAETDGCYCDKAHLTIGDSGNLKTEPPWCPLRPKAVPEPGTQDQEPEEPTPEPATDFAGDALRGVRDLVNFMRSGGFKDTDLRISMPKKRLDTLAGRVVRTFPAEPSGSTMLRYYGTEITGE